MHTRQKGAAAERVAANYLIASGYRILARNFTTRLGELDLIAEEGDLLCVVEVRARATTRYGHPIETISYKKQQRIIRATRCLLARWNCGQRLIRFDVIGIVWCPTLSIQLIRGAFETP